MSKREASVCVFNVTFTFPLYSRLFKLKLHVHFSYIPSAQSPPLLHFPLWLVSHPWLSSSFLTRIFPKQWIFNARFTSIAFGRLKLGVKYYLGLLSQTLSDVHAHKSYWHSQDLSFFIRRDHALGAWSWRVRTEWCLGWIQHVNSP